jgi:hypothetical protein
LTSAEITIVKTSQSQSRLGTRVEGWACPGFTPEFAWRAVLGSVRAVLDGDDKRELLKVSVGGRVVTDDPAMLPDPAGAEGPQAWLSRIQQSQAAGTPVYLYARELSMHDREMFEFLLDAFGPVFTQHGLVRGNIDIEAFLGDYRATPGGIHREQCGNSHFVLMGRKYMHFWHGEDWIPPTVERQSAAGMTAIDPEEYLPTVEIPTVADRGVSLIAGAGEFFTWDPGTWHVGETIGPAFAVNIARYTKSFHPDEGTYPFPDHAGGHVSADWLEGYQAFLGSGMTDEAALARASAYGLEGPEAEHAPAHRLVRVAVHGRAPLLWCESGDRVLVATHGKCRDFPRTVVPWLAGLAGLPAGAPHDVGTDSATLDLARFLHENRAVDAA